MSRTEKRWHVIYFLRLSHRHLIIYCSFLASIRSSKSDVSSVFSSFVLSFPFLWQLFVFVLLPLMNETTDRILSSVLPVWVCMLFYWCAATIFFSFSCRSSFLLLVFFFLCLRHTNTEYEYSSFAIDLTSSHSFSSSRFFFPLVLCYIRIWPSM